jgi:hypothetical protein|tara:strand:- start:156 stop:347 length:192 start_codon:yes stop_codon:yes gene_type:complete
VQVQQIDVAAIEVLVPSQGFMYEVIFGYLAEQDPTVSVPLDEINAPCNSVRAVPAIVSAAVST